MNNKIMRKIINIDEELCNGCGECIPGCPEQALVMVDTPKGTKARMVKEIYCDGLGACLGHCPTGALTIQEREAEVYDDKATLERIKKFAPEMLEEHRKHIAEHAEELNQHSTAACGCPSAAAHQWDAASDTCSESIPRLKSQLSQWPVQLHLLSPQAAYFKNADLAIIADCVPFSYANFHLDFLKDKAVAMGCPKLDDTQAYLEKITQIMAISCLKSIHIVIMEVPCCSGMVQIVKAAMERASINIPLKVTVVGIKGDILSKH